MGDRVRERGAEGLEGREERGELGVSRLQCCHSRRIALFLYLMIVREGDSVFGPVQKVLINS